MPVLQGDPTGPPDGPASHARPHDAQERAAVRRGTAATSDGIPAGTPPPSLIIAVASGGCNPVA
jgi:hypothetical protein